MRFPSLGQWQRTVKSPVFCVDSIRSIEKTQQKMISAYESYREYPAHRALRPYVSCFWTRVSPAPQVPQAHRVLPDGCIDIILDFSPEADPAERIVGTMTRPLLFQPSGPLHLVAVRFRPGGAIPFLRCPAEALTDRQFDLAAAWSAGSRVGERIREVVGPGRQVRRLEAELLRRLSSAARFDDRVRVATALLEKPSRSVASVAREVDVSRQQLGRLFRWHVGIGPKLFQRVARLQQLVARIGTARNVNWPTTALDLGYHDQAHMIAECRALAGLTPGGLIARSAAIARMFHFSNTPPAMSP